MLRPALGVSIGWIGISMISDGVPALLLPHQLVAGGGADATTLGLTTLVAIAVAALLQPFAGGWSDRAGRFPVMAAGSAIAVGGLALLMAPDTALVGTVLALSGVSVAQAGHQALLPDRIRPDWRGRAGGLKSAFDVGGALAGFLVLAALLGSGDAPLAGASLAAVLVAGFLAARLLLPGLPTPAPAVSPPLMSAWRLDLGRHRAFVALVASRFLFLLGIYVVGRFLLLFMADDLGMSADAAGQQAGLALAGLALVTVVASLPSGWLADRAGRRRVMVTGALLAAAGTALLPTAGSLMPILLFGSLMALGSAAFGSASWAMLADLVTSPDAGRLLGVAHAGTAGAAAAAGTFGILIDAAGYAPAFGLAAASTLAGGLLAWRLADGHRASPELVGAAEVVR